MPEFSGNGGRSSWGSHDGVPFRAYGSCELSGEDCKIEQLISDLGVCEQQINPREPNSEVVREKWLEKRDSLLAEIKETLSSGTVDVDLVSRFLKQREAFYTRERDKEWAAGKQEVSTSIIGQLEATAKTDNILKELTKNGKTIG